MIKCMLPQTPELPRHTCMAQPNLAPPTWGRAKPKVPGSGVRPDPALTTWGRVRPKCQGAESDLIQLLPPR